MFVLMWKGNTRKDGVKLKQCVQGQVNNKPQNSTSSRLEKQIASHQAIWHLQINTDETAMAYCFLFDL